MKRLLLMTLMACGPGHDQLKNWNFNFWEDGLPLGWTLDRGEVARVGTWHPRDYGASFVGDDVALSQTVSEYPSCLLIEAITDVEEGVQMRFEIDILDDGTAEAVQQIPRLAWTNVEFNVRLAQLWKTPLRFRIVKEGAGRAVVANIRAREDLDCRGTPHAPENLVLGQSCGDDAHCASGHCEIDPRAIGTKPRSCSGCEGEAQCTDGKVCGIVYSKTSLAWRDCIAPTPPPPATGFACAGEEFSSKLPCMTSDDCPFMEACGSL